MLLGQMTLKRLLKIVALVFVVLVLVVGGVLAVTFMGRKPMQDGFEMNGVRVVLDSFVGIGVVPVGEREVVLIDAGLDREGQAILAELSRRQLGREAVIAILLTHGHTDHVEGSHLFPSAHVMSLESEVALVEGREGSKGPVTRLFPARPTGITVGRALRDGETVTFTQVPIRVFAIPGHTTGSAAYLVNDVLFVGDSADAASDGTLQGAPWIFSDSQTENRASLARLSERLAREGLDVKAIVPAHSGVLTDGVRPLTVFAAANQ